MAWTVDFYEDADGNAPVEGFLDRLPKKQRAKLLGLIGKLMEHGPTLPFPYSTQVEGKVRELSHGLEKPGFVSSILGMPTKNLGCCTEWSRIQRNWKGLTFRRPKIRMADHNQRLVKKEKLKKSEPRVKGE